MRIFSYKNENIIIMVKEKDTEEVVKENVILSSIVDRSANKPEVDSIINGIYGCYRWTSIGKRGCNPLNDTTSH